MQRSKNTCGPNATSGNSRIDSESGFPAGIPLSHSQNGALRRLTFLMLLWAVNISLEKPPAVMVCERELDPPDCVVIVLEPERTANFSHCAIAVPAINAKYPKRISIPKECRATAPGIIFRFDIICELPATNGCRNRYHQKSSQYRRENRLAIWRRKQFVADLESKTG